MFKHILISTDGSELATKGVQRGLELAKALDAKATIITVTALWGPLHSARGARLESTIAALKKEADDEAGRVLEEVKYMAQNLGVSIETVYKTDMSPAEAIVRTAENKNCDLIVMSSHGHRGLRRALLGSQTSEVVNLAEMPVLVIR